MFCNKCGKELAQGIQFCPACGQPVGVAPIPSSVARVANHHKVVGVFWMIFSGLFVLGGLAMVLFVNAIFEAVAHSGQPQANFPIGVIQSVISVIGAVFMAMASVGIFAGWGVFKLLPWGRIVAIVLSFPVMIISIPFGTALGIYTLWVLLPDEQGKEYATLSGAT